MKIAIVVPTFPKISETFIVNKFVGLLDAGLDVHVVCDRFSRVDWDRFPQLSRRRDLRRRVHVNWPHRPRLLAVLLAPVALMWCLLNSPRATVRYMRRGGSALRRLYTDGRLLALKPKIIHFEFGTLARQRAVLKRSLRCKIVASFRGYDLNYVGLDDPDYYTTVWQDADALHLLGEDLWRRAQQRGCPSTIQHELIPPAVDTRFFDDDGKHVEVVGTETRPLRLLSVGRLGWIKGYEHVLESVRQLRARNIHVEYRIIGDGDYFDCVAFACYQLGVESSVELLGCCSQKQVRLHMQWADVLVHGGVSEGFCNAVIEAGAMRLPVVCSDAGGLPENVKHESTGFVVPRRDPSAMAEKLAMLAADPKLRQRMGESGRDRASRHFQLSDQIASFEEFYRGLASPKGDELRDSTRTGIADTKGAPWTEGRVDLIWLGDHDEPPKWQLGKSWKVQPTVSSVHEHCRRHLASSHANAWLFWHESLGAPDEARVRAALARPGDLWHAGFQLGTSGLPRLLDYVAPIWPLNRDPDSGIEATSWRLSLRACLVRCDVLLQMGGLDPSFDSLEAAGLELGHRCISRGVITRHVPWFLSEEQTQRDVTLEPEDELRFVIRRCGRKWARWALCRVVRRGEIRARQALSLWRNVSREKQLVEPAPYCRAMADVGSCLGDRAVSVLIPTVDRYPYLRTLLDQLRRQTVAPQEIIVVDQTPVHRRDERLPSEFSDLPLRVFYQSLAGQCSSRNAGLQVAAGDCILFLDDDDEVESDLIERHLWNLEQFQADVSCGVANEADAGPLPEAFKLLRVSDVFPTNNTMIRRDVLKRSGLFDLAYERGQRADGDLGMRIYLSGALMMLDPQICVFHHHAPAGGLRTHKARVVTYASSRQRLTHRRLPSATEIYLARRYFTQCQLREMLLMALLGTFSVRGKRLRKTAKAFIACLCLPHSWWKMSKNREVAETMLERFPQIEKLNDRAVREQQSLPA